MALLLVPLAARGEVVEYMHVNASGSPVAITNSTGQVLQRSNYGPYGRSINGASIDSPGFSGHVRDEQTAMVYMQQRYYAPELARFLSADPVTPLANPDERHFNRYAYAYNNPYGFTDPDGQCPQGAPKSTCVDARTYDAAKSNGQSIQVSSVTESAMKAGARRVAVGSGTEEKVGFTKPSEEGGETVVMATDAKTGSSNKGFTASASVPDGATAVIHGHLEASGLVDIAGIGDAGPLRTKGLPNAAVSSDGKRIGVTEIVDGQVQFRMIQGKMNNMEIRLKQDRVDIQQSFFQKDP